MHVLLSIASTGRDTGLRSLVMQLLVDWASATHSPNDEFVPAYAQAKQVRALHPRHRPRIFYARKLFPFFNTLCLTPGLLPCRIVQSPSSSARRSVRQMHLYTQLHRLMLVLALRAQRR
jgi:hypothetical protein